MMDYQYSCPHELTKKPGDAGFDVRTTCDIEVPSNGKAVKIPTGLRTAIPATAFIKYYERSGLALRGLEVHGGVVDSSYRGEHFVIVKSTDEHFHFKAGDRIAQFVVHPGINPKWTRVDKISDKTERGDKGFGSSGLA